MTDKVKVLLVEDNMMNTVLVTEILAMNGYEVVPARSGAEAIKFVSVANPDIILMDLHLPEIDGYTATRIIKADAAHKHIPILAITASAMKGDEEKLMRMGFDGYVGKPIDKKKLLETIIQKLDEARARGRA